MNEKLTQNLRNAYSKIGRSSDNITKASVLYNVIQIKSKHNNLTDFMQSIYVDVKQFVDTYVDGVAGANSDFGYDKVNTDKIIQSVKAVGSEKQRIQLWKRAEAELSEHGLNEECKMIHAYCKVSVMQALFCSQNPLDWIKGICYLSVYNFWTVLLTLLIVFIINFVVTLPLSTDATPMFIIEHEQFSDCMLWNHFLTYFAGVLDLTDITFCKAGNIFGFFVLLSFKLFYILYGGWNAVDIIREKLTLKNG